MGLSTQLAQFFLLSLALGMGLFSLLADTNLTGVGLYRIALGIIGGSLTLSLGIHLANNTLLSFHSSLYVLSLTLLSLLFGLHKDQRSPFMWILYTTKIAAISTLGYFFLGNEWAPFVYFLSSTLFLGSVTFIMVLGHWYLVTPKLTEKPLARGLQVIWCIMALKIAFTAWGYFQAQELFAIDALFNGMILTMRITWGYLLIGVLSYFSWKLVNMRSIQSATGIFYVMTFFVFISEMIATYLFYHHGLTL